MKNNRLLAVVGALLLSASASAAQIEYIQTGFGSGTLDGVAFGLLAPVAFTIRATGDTANVQSCGVGCLSNDNLSASIEIDFGGTVNFRTFEFQTATRFFSRNDSVGFSRGTLYGADLYNANVGSNWDMTTAFGPVPASGQLLQWTLAPVSTSGGTLVLQDGTSDGVFQATVGDTSVVPVPGSLLLLGSSLAGLLVVGRRRKVTAA
jgi:hypothetical protein